MRLSALLSLLRLSRNFNFWRKVKCHIDRVEKMTAKTSNTEGHWDCTEEHSAPLVRKQDIRRLLFSSRAALRSGRGLAGLRSRKWRVPDRRLGSNPILDCAANVEERLPELEPGPR